MPFQVLSPADSSHLKFQETITDSFDRVNIHVQSTWPCKLPPRGGLSVCTHRMQTVVPALNLISQNSTSTALPDVPVVPGIERTCGSSLH